MGGVCAGERLGPARARPQPAPLWKDSAPGDPRPTRVLGLRRGKGHGVKYPLAPRKVGKEGKAGETVLTTASKEAGTGRGLGFPPGLEGPFSAS